MLTYESLKKEYDFRLKECLKLRAELRDRKDTLKKKELKRLKDGIPTIKLAMLYMETNPSEQFIINEKNRIARMIKNRVESFPMPSGEYHLSALKEARKKYEKEYDVPKLKKQLQILNFLLK